MDPTWTAVGPYTASFYDGAGRSTLVETWSGSTELWESTTAYGVTSGRTWVTQTDAEGRWLKSYSNGHAELVLVEEPDGGDTTYTYTARGELATVTNDYNTTSTADDITITLGYSAAFVAGFLGPAGLGVALVLCVLVTLLLLYGAKRLLALGERS